MRYELGETNRQEQVEQDCLLVRAEISASNGDSLSPELGSREILPDSLVRAQVLRYGFPDRDRHFRHRSRGSA